MFDYNLILLNEGDIATFNIGGRNGPEKSSVIDLTMTSPECVEYISTWGVIVKDRRGDGSTYNGSDHRTIETRYFTTPPKKVFRHSMKNVDWGKFRESLAQKLCNWEIPRTLTRNQLDAHVKTFNKALTDTWKEFSTLQLVTPRDPTINFWYTSELKKERKGVASLCRTAVRSGEDDDWAAFRDAQRIYSSNLRKAARACYQKFASDLEKIDHI